MTNDPTSAAYELEQKVGIAMGLLYRENTKQWLMDVVQRGYQWHMHDMTSEVQAVVQLFEQAIADAETRGRLDGIKLVDKALLDNVTGVFPVPFVRNIIKLLVWEYTPKGKQANADGANGRDGETK